jgi:hypothetical protein
MSRFGKGLIAAMEEAAAHAQGKGSVARVHHKQAHSPDRWRGHDATHRTHN